MTRGARKDALEYITRSINSTIDSIDCALSDEFAKALEGSARVFVYGAGRSGFVARCFTMRLSHLGLGVVRMSIDDTDPPGERDLTIIISGTGETHSSLLYCRLAKDGGSKVVAITENAKSTLAEMSDIAIHLDAPRDAERTTYAPMGTIFEDTCLIYLDTIVVDLMDRLHETEESMRSRHGQLY